MAEGKSELEVVTTPIFRVSFSESIFAGKVYDGDDAAEKGAKRKKTYGLTGIWTPAEFSDEDKKKWAAMFALADKVAFAFHKKHIKDFPANWKKPVRDGAEKDHLDGYGAGKKFAAMTSTRKVGVFDRNRQPITDEEDFYAGCFARAVVNAYAYDKKGGKGVAFGLINVQKTGKGEPFGASRLTAEESFDDDLGPEEEGEGTPISEDDPF